MKVKDAPNEVGEFERIQEYDFLKYESRRTDEYGDHMDIIIKKSTLELYEESFKKVESFLKNFYDYFEENTTGRTVIFTFNPHRRDVFDVGPRNGIVAKISLGELGGRERAVPYFADLVCKEFGIPSLDVAKRIFTDSFYKDMEPIILSKTMKK